MDTRSDLNTSIIPLRESKILVCGETRKGSNLYNENIKVDTLIHEDKKHRTTNNIDYRPNGTPNVITEDPSSPPVAIAAQAVFNTTELLELILAHLPIKALTRALHISKYCNEVILQSPQLQRTLFLEPETTREHVEWKEGVDSAPYLRCYGEQRRFQPVIVNKISERSQLIVRSHPIIDLDRFAKAWLQSHPTPLDEFRRVAPSTLLFQPPVTKVIVKIAYSSLEFPLECTEGVTFGDVVDEVDMRYGHSDTVTDLCVVAKEAAAEGAKHVEIARKVLKNQLA